MRQGYFGVRANFAWITELPQVEVPIGEACLWCEETVELGDRGVVTPFIGMVDGEPEPGLRAFHLECWMRSITGSAAHIAGRCSCYVDGASETDDPDLTRRQAALVAFELVLLNRQV